MNYCVIIPDFRGIGGAQLYALRRFKYLSEQGFNVSFVVGKIDQIILNGDKKQIPVFICQEVVSYTFDIKKSIRKKTVNHFREFFQGDSCSVIETLDPVGATWGELFACELRCKHIIYSLVESVVHKNIQDRPIYLFYRYKLQRREFIGLSSKSLEKIFGVEFRDTENHYVNLPYDSGDLSVITFPEICKETDKESFIIGTVARLEKTYIPYLIEAVIEFAIRLPNAKITLIVAGDSETGNIKMQFVQKYLRDEIIPRNLKILFPGYLNPLGIDFFNCLDIYVGMGTSAVSSISQGCPTIVVDPINNLSSGILGLDTNNFAYSESGKQFSILESIEELFYNPAKRTESKVKGSELFRKEYSNDICMKKLDNYIASADHEKKYWNFSGNDIATMIIRFFYNKKQNPIIGAVIRLRKLLVG